jgi:hypothetical protein
MFKLCWLNITETRELKMAQAANALQNFLTWTLNHLLTQRYHIYLQTSSLLSLLLFLGISLIILPSWAVIWYCDPGCPHAMGGSSPLLMQVCESTFQIRLGVCLTPHDSIFYLDQPSNPLNPTHLFSNK